MRLIVFLFLLSGCAWFHHDQEPKSADPDLPMDLLMQSGTYCSLSEPAYQKEHWVHSRCDGAGFTSLRAIACSRFDQHPDLSLFQDATGKPFRDPKHQCFYVDNGAKAGYSRDMLLMRMLAAYELKDVAWFDSMDSYGEMHSWVICDAVDEIQKLAHCFVTPELRLLLKDAKAKLHGNLSLQRPSENLTPTDFEAHLDVLSIFLAGEIYGGITTAELDELGKQAAAEPENALFQAVYHRYKDGDQSEALHLLTKYFPVGRLPNNRDDHCEEYLFQRQHLKGSVINPDWLPCPGEPFSEHSGTEFGLTVYILGL